MSMQTWTTYAYGVTDNDIDKITVENMWQTFKNIKSAQGKADFQEKLESYCEDCGHHDDGTIFTENDLSDDEKTEFIRNYYEVDMGIYCILPQGQILAELIAKQIQIPVDDIIVDCNEEGQALVGIPLWLPWEIPASLKDATKETYNTIITNAFAILGVEIGSLEIDLYPLENWG